MKTGAGDHTMPRVLGQLSGFFAFLRTRGLQIGVGAELDLGHGLEVVGVLDRARFHDACRATLAKSPEELALLDAAFDAYWSGLHSQAETIAAPPPMVPPSPPPDRESAREAAPRTSPVSMGQTGAVRVGTYSFDAPPAGHPFAAVDPRRLAAFRAGARRFRRAAATLPGRRLERARRGPIDLRATIRASVRHGGEVVGIRRRHRKQLRAELVVLWDVSGSMREHDDGLLALVYALHRVSRRTRVFAFSTDLEELTGVFAGRAYPIAARATSRALGPAGGGTRIGRCLAEFRRRHGSLVRPRTTVVLVSDGWDLGEAEVLERELDWLHRKAHRFVWVNPYASDPGFRPETAAMRQATSRIHALLSPDDFASGTRLAMRLGTGR